MWEDAANEVASGLSPLDPDTPGQWYSQRTGGGNGDFPVGWPGIPSGKGLIGVKDGIKHDLGKPRMELLDPYALEQVALVLTFGAEKYGAYNWAKGIAYGRLLGATLRHVFAFVRGEDLDKETGLPHLAHAMCELMFLLGMTQRHPELDDREARDDKTV